MGSPNHSFDLELDRIIDYSNPVSLEDDLYYAELERQILKLTADEEGDDRKPSDHLSPSRRASNAKTAETPFVAWSDFATSENDCKRTSPCQIKSNGTGVFIPHVVKSQARRSSPGRTGNNGRRRIYKQKAKNDYQRVISYI